jgi:hypothetical protein
MPANDAARLLNILWTGMPGWGEVRMLKKGEPPLTPYFLPVPIKPRHLELAFEWIERTNRQGRNAYFGVNPRLVHRGRNQDVSAYTAAIADIDNIDLSWGRITKLAKAGCEPSACVRTARGVHLYWFLKEPEAINTDTRDAVRRLQVGLRSDAVHDPARVLRIPETISWGAVNSHEVYLAWLTESKRYTLRQLNSAVVATWPELAAVEAPKLILPPSHLPALGGSARTMDDKLWNYYAQPAVKGTRSERCLDFLQTAVLLGWSDEQITAAFRTLAIGQHYVDRLDGGSSLEYDLVKGRRNVAERMGEIYESEVVGASLIANDPTSSSGHSCKVHLRMRLLGPTPQRIDEWIVIPNPYAVQKRAFDVRWGAFVTATRFQGSPFEWTHLQRLEGRRLRVEIKDAHGRLRVANFLPPG